MLSLGTNHLEGIERGDVRPVILVRIDLDSPPSRIFRAVSGNVRLFNYPNSISSLSPVAAQIDALTRLKTIGSIALECADDDWLRNIIALYRLNNKKLTIKLGSPLYVENEFENLFIGVITDTLPREGSIELKAKDAGRILDDYKVTGAWTGDHPLTILENIIATRAGLSTELYDSNTFDPSDSAYTAISHWNMSRSGTDPNYVWYNKQIVTESPLNSREAVNQIAEILGGQVSANESGALSFTRYDAAGATSDTWSNEDIINLEVLSMFDNAKNKLSIKFNGFENQLQAQAFRSAYLGFVANNAPAQVLSAFPGSSHYVSEHQIATDWLNARSMLLSSLSAGSTTLTVGSKISGFSNITALNPSAMGFAGASFSGADRFESAPGVFGGTQESWQELSAADGRYGYIHIENRQTGAVEIIRVSDPVSFSTESCLDEYDQAWPISYTYTIDARAQFDTSQMTYDATLNTPAMQPYPPDHAPICTDITIAAALGQAVLDRFSYGAPRIRVRTGLQKRAIQVGDFVTMVDDVYASYGNLTLAANTVWEVTSKEEDPIGDSPGINWEFVWVREGATPPSETVTIVVTLEPEPWTLDDVITDSTLAIATTSGGETLYR